MTLYDYVIIAGPTASGKSGLALALIGAGADQIEIVNADSMQVYHGLPVLTAAPTAAERARTPHHLYGQIPPSCRYSQAEWLAEARETVASIQKRGHLPVLVGGTGLYLKAAQDGIVSIPTIGCTSREQAREIYARSGCEGLKDELMKGDAALAEKIEANDRQRLMRGVEVLLETGVPLSVWQGGEAQGRIEGKALCCYIRPPREALYQRIDARFEAMLAGGALEEIKTLAALTLDPELPAMKALGVRPLLSAYRGESEYSEAAMLAKRDSRRYAKRQYTWFDHQFNADLMVTDAPLAQDSERISSEILSKVIFRG